MQTGKLSLPNGAYITNTYTAGGMLASTVLKNSSHATLNSHVYGYDNGLRRVEAYRSDGNRIDYAYDDIDQLQTAKAYESGNTLRAHENMGYSYDAAGNLEYRTNNALVQTFKLNPLNQITNVTRSGTLTVAGTTL